MPDVAEDAGAATSVAQADTYQGAGFGIRLLARLIDFAVSSGVSWLVLVLLYFLIGAIAYIAGDRRGAFASQFVSNQSMTEILMGPLSYLGYHAVAESISGMTVGKRLTGLMVTGENGLPCRIGQAVGRNLALFIDGLLFGLPAVQSMYKSPRRQRNGDVWAHTMVVRLRDLPPGSLPSFLRFVAGLIAAVIAASMIAALGYLARLP